MNSFSSWKSGSSLAGLFNQTPGKSVENYGSIEDFLKGVLGEQYSDNTKMKPVTEEETLKRAKERAEELSKAMDQITKLAEATERVLEETVASEDDGVEEKREEVEEVLEEVQPAPKAYRVFRDKDENFECKITIQGAGLSAAQVRVILDCDMWNFTFYGKLYKDGKCLVPIKKGIPLPEGTRGRARLEVIIDEQLFVPWEDDFVVEGSKKVKVELREQKSIKVSVQTNQSKD